MDVAYEFAPYRGVSFKLLNMLKSKATVCINIDMTKVDAADFQAGSNTKAPKTLDVRIAWDAEFVSKFKLAKADVAIRTVQSREQHM